jgi:hypothetical protein
VQIDIGFEDVHTQLSTIIETRQLGLFGILPPTGLEQYIFHALLIAICQSDLLNCKLHFRICGE